jgi:sulfatase maturation enzyme AslB (radical SAM superfamily)
MRTEMWDDSKKYGLSSLENNTPPELTYLDLSISNTCNNKCRMCMPELSTSWYADAKQLGLEIPKGIITNPLIENGDFSKLKYLKLLGGEPLLEQDKLIKILKQCDLPNLRINLITNTTVIPTEELHNLFTQCKKVSVSLSMDATGALNEFLRKGSEWAKTVETVDWFISNNYDLNVHSVASIYNVNVLHQLNKFCQSKKLIQKCVLVDGPEYMMPRNLPVQVKEKLKKRLEKDKNDAIINTVIKALSTPGNFAVFVENDNKLNELRNEHWKHANPELYKLLRGYL